MFFYPLISYKLILIPYLCESKELKIYKKKKI